MSTRYSETSAEMLRIDPDDDPRTVGPGAAGVRLWAALAVAAIAVAGFGGVVAYGYLAYADRGGLAPAPLVQADTKPVKVKPDDPGGMAVPHQDKGIFDLGRKDAAPPSRPVVENLLPLPEAPLPRPAPLPVPIQPVAADPAAARAAAVQPAAAPEPEPLISTGPPPFPAPLPPPPAPALRVASLQPPAVAPATATSPLAAPVASASARPAAAPAQAAGPTPSAAAPSGRYRIQVGALRSETEARDAWDKVRRKHADVVGELSASYSRVQVPGKGEFIRVQVGPLPDAGAARDACARLSRGGTGCMVVPPS